MGTWNRAKKISAIIMMVLLLPWSSLPENHPVEVSAAKVEKTNKKSVKKDTYANAAESAPATESKYLKKFAVSDDAKKHYYNRILSENAKKVYKAIETSVLKNIQEADTEANVFSFSFDTPLQPEELSAVQEENKEIAYALLADHPEWYWMEPETIEVTETGFKMKIASDAGKKEVREQVEEDILSKVKTFASGIRDTSDRYKVVKEIHDWIIKNTYYVKDAKNQFNIRGALLDGKGVCDSYTRATQLLLNYFDIPNIYVSGEHSIGKDEDTEGHSWNQIAMISDGSWANYDATWDDLTKNAGDEEEYKELDGVSYSYFLRNDAHFTHTVAQGGKYKLHYGDVVRSCTTESFSYFKKNSGILYLEKSTDYEIKTFMTSLEAKLKEIDPIDGIYNLRMGYDASIDLEKILDKLQNETYQAVGFKGVSGDVILMVQDKRMYYVQNNTAPNPKVKIYATMQEYKSGNQTWNANITKTLSFGHKTFYIKLEEGTNINYIQYQINDGSKKYITLKDNLKPVENEERLYQCKLPESPNINPSDEVSFTVFITDDATLKLGFEKDNYSITYGEKVTMKLYVEGNGTHEPTGTFKVYYDKIDDNNEIKALRSIGITDHCIIYEINKDASSTADIGAGVHTIYVEYQGDSGDDPYFKAGQLASTELAIEKATLKYKAEKVTVEYGEPIVITGTYEGFVHGDDETVIEEANQPKFKTTATPSSKPNNYPIMVETDGSCANYTIKPEVGSANVTIKKTDPKIEVTVEKIEEAKILGETIQIEAKLLSSKNVAIQGKATTFLYLEDEKIGDFVEKDGVYSCSYTIPNDSKSSLKFYVKTGASDCFNEKSSEAVNVTVDNTKAYVFFNNSNIGKPVEPMICNVNETMAKPSPEPFDPNYKLELAGWFKSASSNEKWNFAEDKVLGSMTLYAHWEEPIRVPITDVKIIPYTDKDYDGAAHDVVKFEGLQDTDRVTYVLDGKVYTSMPQVKDVVIGKNGTIEGHQLQVLVERRHALDYTQEFVLRINQVQPTIEVSEGAIQLKYTGNPIDVSSFVTLKGVSGDSVPKESIIYRYYTDAECSELTSETDGAETKGGAPKDAGEYYVKVIHPSSGNYSENWAMMKVKVEAKAILILDNVSSYVPAKQRTEGKYELSDMIPAEKELGDVSFKVLGIHEDKNKILETFSQDEAGYLHYIIKDTAEEGQSVSLDVEVKTKNYDPVTVQLILKAKSKTLVKISIKGVEDKIYDGKPFQYGGPYTTTVASSGKTVNLTLKIRYTGIGGDGKSYDSETAPTDVGKYTLTLEVPSDHAQYRGKESYIFEIKPKKVVVKAKDISIAVGADAPSYTAECSELVGDDKLTDLVIRCDYKKNDSVNGIAKTYDIVISGGTTTKPWNYEVQYQKGILSVKNVHTVTFQLGIDGAKNPTPIKAIEGEAVVMPAATTIKEGCLFVGWSYNGTVYKTDEAFIMLDQDVQLVAQWGEKTRVTGIKVKYKGADVLVGTELVKSDFVVTIHYSNGKTEDTTQFTMEGNKIEKEGSNLVTITYLTFREQVVIKGVINHVKSVTASYKGNVLAGTKIDTNQLTVTLHYDDGKTEVITKDYEIENYGINLGKNTLKLKYKDLTTTFEVTGIAAEGQAVLTFDSQGGTPVSNAVVDVGKTYTPSIPSKDGYDFDGWYTSSGNRFTGSTIVDGSKTLYAHWRANDAAGTYRIHAAYYGELKAGPLKQEDFRVSETNNIGIQKLVTGFTLNPSSLKVGVNYVLVTYNHVSVLVTLVVPNVPQKITVTTKERVYGEGYVLQNKDLIVTAVDAEGKTLEVKDKEFVLSNNVIKNGINVVDITYDGKTDSFEVLGKKSYKVSFVTNGDKEIDPIQVIEGATIGKLPIPKKKQYRFLGWYLDSACEKRCTESNKVTQNMTLYADWESANDYKISKENVHINVNGQESIYIDGAKQVQWVSDDVMIAYIDQNGIITGMGPGTVMITGYTDDGYELYCMVTVGPLVKKIQVSKTRVTIKRGKKFDLKASVYPKKAATKELYYSTSNSKVAKVSKTGVVTAVKKGTCYITILASDVSKVEKKVKIIVK